MCFAAVACGSIASSSSTSASCFASGYARSRTRVRASGTGVTPEQVDDRGVVPTAEDLADLPQAQVRLVEQAVCRLRPRVDQVAAAAGPHDLCRLDDVLVDGRADDRVGRAHTDTA